MCPEINLLGLPFEFAKLMYTLVCVIKCGTFFKHYFLNFSFSIFLEFPHILVLPGVLEMVFTWYT